MRKALPLLILPLTRCASARHMDRRLLSQCTSTGPRPWEMTANAAGRGAQTDEGEATRLGWIRDYTQANGCNAYEITERRLTKAPPQRSMLGIKTDGDTIRYSGTCR